MTFVMNDLDEYIDAADGDNVVKIEEDALMVLVYAARNTHGCSVSNEEHEKIMEVVHEVEYATGIKYTFDSEYNHD